MTCIVGYVDDDKNIWMGGDSAGTNGRFQQRIRTDEKVFIKDNMIFGFTTSFRMGQLLRYALTIPEHSRKKDTMTYMCTDFIESVRSMLKEKGFNSKEKDVDLGGTFLVGYQGNLFEIADDYQVAHPSQNFEACGCGGDLAVSAMYTMISLKLDLSPEKMIRRALKAAYKFSAGVKPPFKILKLQNN